MLWGLCRLHPGQTPTAATAASLVMWVVVVAATTDERTTGTPTARFEIPRGSAIVGFWREPLKRGTRVQLLELEKGPAAGVVGMVTGLVWQRHGHGRGT